MTVMKNLFTFLGTPETDFWTENGVTETIRLGYYFFTIIFYKRQATFLLGSQKLALFQDVTSVLGIQARVGATATGAEVAEKIETDEAFVKGNMTSLFGKLRGFPPYWHSVKLKLRSHLIAFGPPTWFLTLSPAETEWKTVVNLYKKFKPPTRVRSDYAHLG